MEQLPKKAACPEEIRIGKEIQVVANLFRRLGDENLSHHAINISQLRILGYLRRGEGRGAVFQKDLEEAFGVRRSSVTSIVKNMERSGYLIRENSPEDARLKEVRLTEKGRELDDALRSFILSLEKEMTRGLTREELAVLKKALLCMQENLEEIERKKV